MTLTHICIVSLIATLSIVNQIINTTMMLTNRLIDFFLINSPMKSSGRGKYLGGVGEGRTVYKEAYETVNSSHDRQNLCATKVVQRGFKLILLLVAHQKIQF